MKKIAAIFISSILLAACTKTTQTSTSETTPSPVSQTVSSDDFAAIAAAQTAGQPISCTLSKSDDSTSMQYVMKEKKMEITGMQYQGKTQNTTIISDGEYFYSWDTTTKKGIKMKVPSEADIKDMAAKAGQPVPSLRTEEDKKKFEDQGYSVKCAITDVSDSEFVPPTDVTYSDMSAMMENAKTMMKDSNSSPSAQSMEEMKQRAAEMMKQYQK